MAAISRRNFGLGAVGATGLAVLAACSRTAHTAVGSPRTATTSAQATAPTQPPAAPVALTFNPADGAAKVNPAVPISVVAANGTVDTVTLLSSSGATVPGTLSDDKTLWTASEPLGYGRAYTLTASAVNADGVATSKTAKFSTLTPGNMTMPYLNTRGGAALKNGTTVGVGFVVRVHFDEAITHKAAAEQALQVTTTPEVTGGWFWLDDQDALWRPEVYFPSGTQVTVAANVYGVEVGPGLYGQSDVSASFTVGPKHLSIADDKTHQVQVYFDDVLQRTMPTSMGKGGYTTGSDGQSISFYTPSGTYTVLDKSNPVLMDSASYGLPVDGPGGYSEYISWATRISTDGIYLHELDTTVWAQGHVDTSHGCLNLNRDNATWFFKNAQVGDVVTIKHTGGAPLAQWQNGDWDLSWAQWQAGSALHA